MTSTVKTNTITTATGSTLTIGESGKTVALASGATASGFAAVAWQSTVVTGATHTASANQGIWIDASSNACNCSSIGNKRYGS